jgi:probable HAF family extracellular repeat protein
MKKSYLLGAVLIVGFFITMPAYAYQFTVTDLGQATVYALNNNSQVVGTYDTNNGQRSFIWENGISTPLGEIPGALGNHQPNDINNNGQVIVRTTTTLQTYFWDNGLFTNIGNLPNSGGISFGTEGRSMNDLGQVVGESWTGAQDGYHAFLYDNGIADMCGSVGTGGGSGVAINNSGQVVGWGCGYSSFFWENGGFTDLGEEFKPVDINDSGLVIGYDSSSNNSLAMWENGVLTSLTNSNFIPTSINDLGVAVGKIPGGTTALWTASNGIQDLNNLIDPILGITLISAVDINDIGQIVVRGEDQFGVAHSYLLTAVPLPPALWLFGTGLVGLLGIARRMAS